MDEIELKMKVVCSGPITSPLVSEMNKLCAVGESMDFKLDNASTNSIVLPNVMPA